MTLRDTKMPDTACLECGKPVDRGLSLNGQRMKPGDLTICLNCSALAVFAEDRSLRPLTDEELVEVAGSVELRAHLDLLADFRAWRKAEGLAE